MLELSVLGDKKKNYSTNDHTYCILMLCSCTCKMETGSQLKSSHREHSPG